MNSDARSVIYGSNREFSISKASLTILDTYIHNVDFVTIMFADSSDANKASCKIIQFDLNKYQYRTRSVTISTNGSIQTVTAGVLLGQDSGIFGGQVTTFGYENSEESTCEASTSVFKYPQQYSGTSDSSVSSGKLGYIQSITLSDSCLPFDSTYGSWYTLNYVSYFSSDV